MTEQLQLGPQFDEVIDLAIEDDEESAIGAAHRLPASLAQIENRQPAMAENRLGVDGRRNASAELKIARR